MLGLLVLLGRPPASAPPDAPLGELADLDGVALAPGTRRGHVGAHLVEVVTWRDGDALGAEIVLRTAETLDGVQLDAAAVGPGDRTTGDDAFDDAVWITARRPGALLGILDPETRAVLRRAVEDGVRVHHGTVTYRSRRPVASADGLRRDVDRLVDVADRLAASRSSRDRRIAAVGDPCPPVRRGAILALVAEGYTGPLPAAAGHVDDPDPEVALAASLLAGVDLAPAARRCAMDPTLAPSQRVKAITLAGDALSDDELVALCACPEPIGDAALEAVERGARSGAAIGLARRVATGDALAEPAARALARVGGPDPDVAQVLVDALDASDAVTRARAAALLGRVGTVAHVAALQRHADALLESPRVRQAARASIAMVQEGVPASRRGGLHVAEPVEGGELAVVPDAGGVAVHLPREPAGEGKARPRKGTAEEA